MCFLTFLTYQFLTGELKERPRDLTPHFVYIKVGEWSVLGERPDMTAPLYSCPRDSLVALLGKK